MCLSGMLLSCCPFPQLIALASLHRIPWYTPTQGTLDLRTYVAPETSVIYLTNLAQFVILAVVFNKGYPHRQVGCNTQGQPLVLLLAGIAAWGWFRLFVCWPAAKAFRYGSCIHR